MSITLARIDDRVIHGQITTRWSKARQVNSIIVISDTVCKDPLRRKVLKAAAGDLKLGIYPLSMAAEKIKSAMESTKKFFIISDSPKWFAEMAEIGINFGEILNVGCMNTRQGATVLGRTVAIDENDCIYFDLLSRKGVKLEFQLLPDDFPDSWENMRKKYISLNNKMT